MLVTATVPPYAPHNIFFLFSVPSRLTQDPVEARCDGHIIIQKLGISLWLNYLESYRQTLVCIFFPRRRGSASSRVPLLRSTVLVTCVFQSAPSDSCQTDLDHKTEILLSMTQTPEGKRTKLGTPAREQQQNQKKGKGRWGRGEVVQRPISTHDTCQALALNGLLQYTGKESLLLVGPPS